MSKYACRALSASAARTPGIAFALGPGRKAHASSMSTAMIPRVARVLALVPEPTHSARFAARSLERLLALAFPSLCAPPPTEAVSVSVAFVLALTANIPLFAHVTGLARMAVQAGARAVPQAVTQVSASL